MPAMSQSSVGGFDRAALHAGLRVAWIVFCKEVLEAIRDYRSLIPSVFLALAIGPVVTIFAPLTLEGEVKKVFFEHYNVGLSKAGEESLRLILPNVKESEFKFKILPEEKLSFVDNQNLDVDIIVKVSAPYVNHELLPASQTKPPEIIIVSDSRRPQSQLAGLRLGGALNGGREALAQELKGKAGITLERPACFESSALVRGNYGAASPFVRMTLPSIMLFLAFLGTIYPALDSITGERQRGSLELLLVSRASRRGIFFGKLFTVTACAYLPCVSGLLGFYFCQFFQPKMAQVLPMPFISILPLECMSMVAVLTLPICLTLACAALALSAFARSVQQGQGYFLPLMLVTFVPAALVMNEALPISPALCLAPFVNCIALMDSILAGSAQPLYFLLTTLSSFAFAAICAYIVTPVMEREELLFSLEESPQRRYETGDFRREVFFLLVFVFLLMFYLSQTLVIEAKLWGIFWTQVLVVFLPAFVLTNFWLKLPLPALIGLRFKPAQDLPLCLAAALTSLASVGCSLYYLQFVYKYFPNAQALGEKMSRALGLSEKLDFSSPLTVFTVLLIMALMPALMEEFLFRGVITGLLPKAFDSRLKIFIVGGLFGLFHMSILRILPTGILGFVLTWLRLRSGSLVPCVCLHFCHNALTLFLPSLLIGKNAASGVLPELPPLMLLPLILVGCLAFAFLAWRLSSGGNLKSNC
jgi:sodium transport system permease protein